MRRPLGDCSPRTLGSAEGTLTAEPNEPPLTGALYEELRHLARRSMAGERRRHTLQATALVHEAWVKLSEGKSATPESRAHFLRLAARAMREVLIDHARARRAEKRGGGAARVELEEAVTLLGSRIPDLPELDDALTELAGVDPELAKLTELRFFGGLTMEESADALGLSLRTAERSWRLARAWLRNRLDREGAHGV